ncbi:UDP-N-acetylmuramate--L-alanine ligase [Myxosarcina sp. GI1]|uniref:UDP-N-acetylmuramate--L-alanine ligase n=1 Tax=Myxosarcina sp. GI1 TaxID=1541065 RepID=UPI003528124C
MSALAYVVARRKLPVSGSDLKESHITQRLQSLGVNIFNRQEAKNIQFFSDRFKERLPISTHAANSGEELVTRYSVAAKDAADFLPQVICSTAIAKTNPEYRAAVELGCPIFHRSDLLAASIDEYESIAVSGTHGKTTTSSMIGYMLLETDLDPTIIVGGEVDAWQGNARVGNSNYLVAEADESDGSLVKHSPNIGVITNIELDHPDRYKDIREVVDIFQIFAGQCNTLIGCLDDRLIREELAITISYSLDPERGADYTVTEVTYGDRGSKAKVWERGVCLGELQLQLLGKHNLSNALAAVAVGRKLGLEFGAIAKALAGFGGTKRRFEHRGEAGGITFIDDYAHHPSEIEVTLAAARLRVEGDNNFKRVVAIFQPHRYTRTETFLQEFATVFSDADLVVITDIYSAGETNVNGISGKDLVAEIAKNHQQVYYHDDLATLDKFLNSEILRSGDLAMFLGAGNLNQIIPKAIEIINDER